MQEVKEFLLTLLKLDECNKGASLSLDSFKDLSLITEALTHRSYAYEHKSQNKSRSIKNNQRLEFLGDSVLNLVINDYLFLHYSKYSEGELSHLRSTLICEPALSRVAKKLRIGKYLYLGKGEEKSVGRKRDSNLADCLEALVAAFYLYQGFVITKKYVLLWFETEFKNIHGPESSRDAKSQLQELTQKELHELPIYKEVSQEGPDHRKRYAVCVLIQEKECGIGTGYSLQSAEQDAASKVLVHYKKKKKFGS